MAYRANAPIAMSQIHGTVLLCNDERYLDFMHMAHHGHPISGTMKFSENLSVGHYDTSKGCDEPFLKEVRTEYKAQYYDSSIPITPKYSSPRVMFVSGNLTKNKKSTMSLYAKAAKKHDVNMKTYFTTYNPSMSVVAKFGSNSISVKNYVFKDGKLHSEDITCNDGRDICVSKNKLIEYAEELFDRM